MIARLSRMVHCNDAGLMLCLALIPAAALRSTAGESATGSETNATNISIQVQSPDGKPLSHAVVVYVGGADTPTVLSGTAIVGGRERFQTDGEGRRLLPLSGTNLAVMVANDKGFCLMQTRDLPHHPTMTVEPWACIEGVRLNRGKPVTHVNISYFLSIRYQVSMDLEFNIEEQCHPVFARVDGCK